MTALHFRQLSLKYGFLLLIGLIIEWWIVWYSPLNLPEKIPSTPIRVDGILLIILFLIVFIKAEKDYLKANSEATILELTILGTVICLLAEIIFQLIRQPFLNAVAFSEHLYYYTIGVLVVTVFCAFLSFLVAFQLKTKQTFKLVLIIIGFVVLINGIKHFFPGLFGPY